MSLIKIEPEYLKPGDEVAIISPSFCVNEDKIAGAVNFLNEWGLNVRVGKNALRRNGPFAGNDQERLDDLQEMVDLKTIKAVFCSRGGYGISRIIDKVDFSALKSDPKWFVGFSDITVLHNWLNEVCGIVSIHADMPVHYNDPDKNPENFTSLRDALTGKLKNIEWTGQYFRPGRVTGELTGGNLSLLYSLMGTPGEPDTSGKILFIEEVGESIYHLDRMLISLKLAGKLRQLSGLIVGGMTEISDTKIPWGRSIQETILDIVEEYDYPVAFGFPAGHTDNNRAFYIGRRVGILMDKDKITLSYI